MLSLTELVYQCQDKEIKLSEVAAFEEDDTVLILDEENGQWDRDMYARLSLPQDQYTSNKIHCYIFHDLCWNRVMDHFDPEGPDLVSLHKALFCFGYEGIFCSNFFSSHFFETIKLTRRSVTERTWSRWW